MHPNPLRAGYASILCAIFIWAGWMLTTRFLATGALNAYDISALRFLAAGACLVPVAWQRGLRIGPYGWWGSLALCFFLGPTYTIVCATGMKFAPASHAAAIVNGFMVLTSTLLGVYWLNEPFSLKKKCGIAILLAGMGCVAWAKTGGTASFGHLFFAVGGAMWAGYGISLRRWKVSSWHATAVTSVLSALLYLPIYFFFLPKQVGSAPWSLLLFHSFYQGLMTAVLALFLYGKAVHTLGASTAAAFVPLVPVLTLLLGIPFLGEIPGALEITGVAMVFLGLLVVVVNPGRRSRPSPRSGH
jgi:drug/metabolite transporter (DMT)-like permease